MANTFLSGFISIIALIWCIIMISVGSTLSDSSCPCDFGLYSPAKGIIKECSIRIKDIPVNSTCEPYDIISLHIDDCTNNSMRIVFYEGAHCTPNKEIYQYTYQPGTCYTLNLPPIDNHTIPACTAELKCK